ncbi:hypothetical protein RhiirA5_440903 [Rhizophagus irregularis]|uniref:Uncharacterized protein n=1 Tax=Rhizophagus irregularis TaxID=588596 RepID=A0A2N0NG70_9GLOM|nr:hypothetical protein RhiirA5_440903 [Rhizophagus irregularis]
MNERIRWTNRKSILFYISRSIRYSVRTEGTFTLNFRFVVSRVLRILMVYVANLWLILPLEVPFIHLGSFPIIIALLEEIFDYDYLYIILSLLLIITHNKSTMLEIYPNGKLCKSILWIRIIITGLD